MSRAVGHPGIGAQRGLSYVFEDTVGAVPPRTPGEVRLAFATGHFHYELGYAPELKLAELLAARHGLPLIWFGLFRSWRELGGLKR